MHADLKHQAYVSGTARVCLLQHIQHTVGIYSFFASLTQAARREPGQALCWWETGVMCQWRYRVVNGGTI